MRELILALLLLFPQAAPKPPKNDPNGLWQSDTGTKFQLTLTDSDSDLRVRLVDGSNPVYVKYEVDLKRTSDDPNIYAGSGYFIAKLKDKECRFDTSWNIAVVQPDTIAGYISHVVPDPATCEVKDRQDEFTQLKKVK
jgi:hypothetical protein